MRTINLLWMALLLAAACNRAPDYDVIIRGGNIADGTGSPMFMADVGIRADTLAFVGDLSKAKAATDINAEGMVVAPGFINMLSWSVESLIEDGRSEGDIRQGVTLEVLGEGDSWGPLNGPMKKDLRAQQGDIKYDIGWTTLGEYLEYLRGRGVSTNIASFVGATTVRINLLGYDDRQPTAAELDSMKTLVRQAMEEGAVGLSSALEYVPASFATPAELTELCRVVAEYDGLYISHLRNEDDRLLEAIHELISVAAETGVKAEIYHFKQVGKTNWAKFEAATALVDSARAAGLRITADMYNYAASATGFDILMPAWVQEGGTDMWIERLKDPDVREKIGREISSTIKRKPGSAERILIAGFNTDSLKYLQGKTLAEIAALRKKSPEETVMDLVIDDHSRVSVVYFSMSEDNIRKEIALPWMSFGSDGQSMATEGVFLRSSTHPRAYGNFARLLGKYVREEKIITVEEAVRKLTSMPAASLGISKRGQLMSGFYADVVVFDPEKVADHATFDNPHQYSTGVEYVLVNGTPVLMKGEHTGAMPGRVVRGPGWKQ